MTKNNKWTAADIPDLTGKVAVVTGANSGIGYETARALAGKGATTILACRNQVKGKTAVQNILTEHPQAKAELMLLDLSDLASVAQFAEEVNGRFDRLDLLINNAGVMMPPFGKTADGFELQFGTNHLGHFALTARLFDLIARTPQSRIINVASTMHKLGKIDFTNLHGENGYSPQRAYGQSKLANLLFTYELQRRLKKAGHETVTAAAHPGWTETNLQEHSSLFKRLNPFFAQRPEMGALPTLYAAVALDVGGGDYYGPDGFMEAKGFPKQVQSNGRSHDTAVAAKLWTVSEEMTGVQFEV